MLIGPIKNLAGYAFRRREFFPPDFSTHCPWNNDKNWALDAGLNTESILLTMKGVYPSSWRCRVPYPRSPSAEISVYMPHICQILSPNMVDFVSKYGYYLNMSKIGISE